MQTTKTARGFHRAEFKDGYGVECSIQKSSSATEDCIWLGVNDPTVKVMARTAPEEWLTPGPESRNGWVDVPLPVGVNINGRMHLTQQQAAELIVMLQRFVDTGDLVEG